MARHLSESTLQYVRGRIGVDDNEADTSRDEEILAMSARSIIRCWFGWRFGDPRWAEDVISLVEQAYGIELKEPKL